MTNRDKARLASLRIVPGEEELLLPNGGQADIAKLFELHLEPVECFWIVGNDMVGNVHTIVEVARGNHHSVEVDIASTLTAVLATGASAFSVIHNHPTMSVLPSPEDLGQRGRPPVRGSRDRRAGRRELQLP